MEDRHPPPLMRERNRTRWVIAIAACGVAALSVAWFVGAFAVTTPPGPAPGAAALANPEAPIGTVGDIDGPPSSTLGTWITGIRSLGGREDLSGLVGHEVRITVDVGRRTNDVAFWIGTPPDDLLVVISRDDRTGADRQLGDPSSTDIGSPPPGAVTIVGTIEKVPYAEATYSWGLTRRDVDLLAERGVYVKATKISSATPDLMDERLTAEELQEAARETASPPGDQVETPLDIPPPLP